MTQRLRLLLVEDVENDALLLGRELRKGGIEAECLRVETPEDLKSVIEGAPWDAVLADYNLPSFTGLDALRIVRERKPLLPFILVSGAIGEEKAVEALHAGANDYIIKGQYTRLASALERAVRNAFLERERQQTAEELRRHRNHLEELVRQRTAELAETNELLREKEEQFHLMVDGVQDYAIFMLDPQGRVLTWNRGAERIKGYCGEEIIGRHISCFYIPEDRGHGLPEASLRIAETEGRYEEDGWRVRRDGSRFWASVLITAMYTPEGTLRGFSKVARDMSERKRTEEALKASLADKDILMRELAHRTKNNMQVISSVIGLQAAAQADQALTAALADTQNRIRAMALVHEKLYRSREFSSVNMKDYAADLANALVRANLVAATPVTLCLDIEDISFSIDAAVHTGLIINELVSNSLKYAFPENVPGTISLSLRRIGEEAEMRYRDAGPGLPGDLDLSRIKSLGLKLVYNLATRQLRGRMRLQGSPGTEFVFRFNIAHLQKM